MTDVRYTLDFGAARHVSSLDGHYEVVPQAMPYQAARQYCQTNNHDLASLHSSQEQQLAADQCAKFTQSSCCCTPIWPDAGTRFIVLSKMYMRPTVSRGQKGSRPKASVSA